MRYAFEELRLPKVVAAANPANAPSWRVLERAGLKRIVLTASATEPLLVYALERSAFTALADDYRLDDHRRFGIHRRDSLR